MEDWRYLEQGGKRAVIVAHRRWGKDDVALHFTATQMVQKPGNYWHMLPKYEQARKVIWDAVNPSTGKKRIDEAFPPEIRSRTSSQQMLIETITGSVWQLVGSDNYDQYVGSPPIGIVFSEWSLANPMAWAFVSPILEANGGWAAFIYTSRGNNHGRTMYDHACKTDGWHASKIPATDTPVFGSDQLNRIKAELISIYGFELGSAMYNQEYLCSWEGAILGSYFSRQMSDARDEGRISSVPHSPGQEVDTFWDLGVDDSMSIWFMQRVGKSYHFIDYYEASGYGLEHYAKLLKEKPYLYGNHYMPHDANQREMSSSEIARSRKEVAEGLGIRPIIVTSRVRNIDTLIQVHIPAMRNIIPSCWFDSEKCKQGIACLENYSADYDESKKVIASRPKHDWSSHGSDAFRTFAVGYRVSNNEPLPNMEFESLW
jgi:hypothetical protein